jgi:hypothetical protein
MKTLFHSTLIFLTGILILTLGFPTLVQAKGSWPGKIFLPLVSAPAGQDSNPAPLPPVTAGWLGHLNVYRAAAGLTALTENTTWSDGDQKHSRYTVANNELAHTEDTSKPYYTPEGKTAAANSNVMAYSSTAGTDDYAIDLWMEGPFHALGILDPHLTSTGFGSFRDPKAPGMQMAAALDVLRGRGNLPVGFAYPAMWPGSGSSVSLADYSGGEWPDPLTPCPGYTTPTGLPIILQLGDGSQPTALGAASISHGSAHLAACAYDGQTYKGDSTGTANAILKGRQAIVLIPRAPLVHGETYTVSITDHARVYTWSFTIAK